MEASFVCQKFGIYLLVSLHKESHILVPTDNKSCGRSWYGLIIFYKELLNGIIIFKIISV